MRCVGFVFLHVKKCHLSNIVQKYLIGLPLLYQKYKAPEAFFWSFIILTQAWFNNPE